MAEDDKAKSDAQSLTRREFLGTATKVAATTVVAGAFPSFVVAQGSKTFDWKMAAGSTVTISLFKHQMTDALLSQIQSFESLTGMKAHYDVITLETFYNRVGVQLAAGGQGLDVVSMDPFHVWVYASPNGLRSVDQFLQDPKMLAQDYDFEEILPNVRDSFRWNGKAGGGLGAGPQWGVPLIFEEYSLQWRADRFQQFGITAVPQTLQEVRDAAKKLTGTIDGKKAYGLGQRGSKSWTTIHPGYMSMFYAWGGRDFDSQMRCVIDSDQSVAFTDLWLQTLREAGPPNWLTQTWTDDATDFLAGTSSILIDADIEVPYFENPKNTEVYGKIATDVIPAAPDGTRASNMWSMGLSIPEKAPNPVGAWLFLQWASHRNTLQQIVNAGNGVQDTVRPSVVNSPAYLKSVSVPPSWLPTYKKTVSFSRVLYTPQPQWQFTMDAWVDGLQQAYQNPGTTKRALTAAANRINDHLKSMGVT